MVLPISTVPIAFNYTAFFKQHDFIAAYALLVLTFVSCYITKNLFLRAVIFFLTLFVALHARIINGIGLAVILIMAMLFYGAYRVRSKRWRGLSFVGALILSIAMISIRPFPGIDNWPAILKMRITPDAIPYSMWFTFDKSLIGLFFIAFSTYTLAHDGKWRETLKWGLLIGLIAAMTLIPLSFYLNYVKLELKLNNFLLLWMLNNLLFVCLAEEALFRGMIQKSLMLRMQHLSGGKWLALFLAAALFGLVHYRGGLNYMLLASLAGCFYGYAFMKTDKIETSVLAHFTVNLIHFIGFTYPALRGA